MWDLKFIKNIPVTITGVFGRRMLKVKDFLALKKGHVLELDKFAGEPIDLYMNGRHIARGEIVITNDRYGIRLTDIIEKSHIKSKDS